MTIVFLLDIGVAEAVAVAVGRRAPVGGGAVRRAAVRTVQHLLRGGGGRRAVPGHRHLHSARQKQRRPSHTRSLHTLYITIDEANGDTLD